MRRSPLVALALLAAGPALATVHELPFELPLEPAPIVVVIDDSQVDVIVEAGAQPMVRARVAPGSAGAPPALDVGRVGDRVRIAPAIAEAAGESATVILEITLDPTQSLLVTGARLSVAVGNPPRPPASPRPPAGRAGGDAEGGEPQAETSSQRYELTDSELFTGGAAATSVVARNTVVHVEDGAGDLDVDLNLGSLSVRRHAGSLRLASIDAESTVEDLEGVVDFTLEGGSLELGSGRGPVQGKSTRGFVACNRWTGSVSLTGDDASFELRDSQVEPLRFTTKSSDVRIDGLRGSVFAQLEGGELAGESLVGPLDVAATAAAGVEVIDHDGPLTVAARDDASAELSEIGGLVTANLDRATMTLTGADNLNLTAKGSRVTASGLGRLSNCVATSSELNLDLSGVDERTLDLRVTDGSTVEVTLRAPCQVQLRESAAASQQVDVTGCEFQLQSTGRWRGGMRRDAEGRPPFLLTAKVAATGLLRVRGGP